jgi:hypothetical protein
MATRIINILTMRQGVDVRLISTAQAFRLLHRMPSVRAVSSLLLHRRHNIL